MVRVPGKFRSAHRDRDGVHCCGSDCPKLARFFFRFAWHLTSVTWAVLALILVQLVRDAGTARWWAAASTGLALTAVGLFDAVYNRGRHVGWRLLTGIGLAALLSLAL